MKRRLMSLMLIVVMVLSLAACGEKKAKMPETVQEVVAAMGELDLNTVAYTFDIAMGEDEYMGFEMFAANKSNTEGYVDISVKFNIGEYSVSDYTNLTTIYVNGEEVYINLKSVLDFVVAVDEQFAAVMSYFALPGDYIKVTLDDVKSLYASMGIDMSALDTESIMNVSEEDNKKVVDATVAFFGGFLQELATKSNTATVANGVATFKIDSTNCQAFIDGLSTIDLEKYITDYATALEAVPAMAATVEQLRSSTEGLNASLTEAKDSFNAENFGTATISTSFGIEDRPVAEGSKETKRISVVNFSMNIPNEESGNMSMVVDMDMTPDMAAEYTLPASVMTVDELMQMLSDLGVM